MSTGISWTSCNINDDTEITNHYTYNYSFPLTSSGYNAGNSTIYNIGELQATNYKIGEVVTFEDLDIELNSNRADLSGSRCGVSFKRQAPLEDYRIGFYEDTDDIRAGMSGSERPIVLKEDDTITSGKLLEWGSTGIKESSFNTSNLNVDSITGTNASFNTLTGSTGAFENIYYTESLINPNQRTIHVGSSGYQFTSPKTAYIYARDNLTPTENDQINIHVHSGKYVEDWAESGATGVEMAVYINIIGDVSSSSKPTSIIEHNGTSSMFHQPINVKCYPKYENIVFICSDLGPDSSFIYGALTSNEDLSITATNCSFYSYFTPPSSSADKLVINARDTIGTFINCDFNMEYDTTNDDASFSFITASRSTNDDFKLQNCNMIITETGGIFAGSIRFISSLEVSRIIGINNVWDVSLINSYFRGYYNQQDAKSVIVHGDQFNITGGCGGCAIFQNYNISADINTMDLEGIVCHCGYTGVSSSNRYFLLSNSYGADNIQLIGSYIDMGEYNDTYGIVNTNANAVDFNVYISGTTLKTTVGNEFDLGTSNYILHGDYTDKNGLHHLVNRTDQSDTSASLLQLTYGNTGSTGTTTFIQHNNNDLHVQNDGVLYIDSATGFSGPTGYMNNMVINNTLECANLTGGGASINMLSVSTFTGYTGYVNNMTITNSLDAGTLTTSSATINMLSVSTFTGYTGYVNNLAVNNDINISTGTSFGQTGGICELYNTNGVLHLSKNNNSELMGMYLSTDNNAANSSSRIFMNENNANKKYGFSIVQCGDTNPILDGVEMDTAIANSLSFIYHSNDEGGKRFMQVSENNGDIQFPITDDATNYYTAPVTMLGGLGVRQRIICNNDILAPTFTGSTGSFENLTSGPITCSTLSPSGNIQFSADDKYIGSNSSSTMLKFADNILYQTAGSVHTPVELVLTSNETNLNLSEKATLVFLNSATPGYDINGIQHPIDGRMLIFVNIGQRVDFVHNSSTGTTNNKIDLVIYGATLADDFVQLEGKETMVLMYTSSKSMWYAIKFT